MARYAVPFVAVASKTITVEADSPEEALEVACDEFDYERENIGNGFELGDWEPEAEAAWMTPGLDPETRLVQSVHKADD